MPLINVIKNIISIFILFSIVAIVNIVYTEESSSPKPEIKKVDNNPVIIQKTTNTDIISSIPTKEGFLVLKKNTEIKKLENEIENSEGAIQDIEKEINEINKGLRKVYKEKDSLESELNKISLVNKKNEAAIRLTKENIDNGKLQIKSLSGNIEVGSENIEILREVLIKNYQRSNEFEISSKKTALFLDNNFFDVLDRIEEIHLYSSGLKNHLDKTNVELVSLKNLKIEFLSEKQKQEIRQKELSERKKIFNASIKEKEKLVVSTKNSEEEYQKLLREKQKQRIELLRDVAEYESKIDFLLDPDSIPEPGRALFIKPFLVDAILTQGYGRTSFAIKNAKSYGGRAFHTGIDFGLPSGTQLIAPADGVVVGVGNTDAVSSCQSWGKWLLISHPFGLSTLYAHLSLVRVALGEKVKKGDIIGYSGNTGFSTGPHLHFATYISDGVKVVPYSRISSSSRCRGVLVPVAAESSRLNPLDYLP